MISFASLTSLKKLLVLTVAGGPQEEENVLITGSIVPGASHNYSSGTAASTIHQQSLHTSGHLYI